jgi:UDP-2,3-diacylglucosamine hydrolase
MYEVTADASWRAIELLSDVHLGPGMPATFDAWAMHLQHSDADALFILGDLFEVWVGDDARGDAFEARCIRVLADAASRRAMFFIAGNRDFLLGSAALRDAQVTPLPDPTLLAAFGMRIMLTHGDALCLADTDYQRFRAEVRSTRWERDFLARPLVERWRIARELRDASAGRQRALSTDQYADVDGGAALSAMRDAGAHAMIHGHTHRPATEALAPGFVRHVLSDWNFEEGACRGDVLRLSASGVERAAPRRSA